MQKSTEIGEGSAPHVAPQGGVGAPATPEAWEPNVKAPFM